MPEDAAVYCYVQLISGDGSTYFQRFVAIGSDHEAAAAQAFEAFSSGSASWRIVGIETFDSPPQRWDGRYTVEPRHFTLDKR